MREKLTIKKPPEARAPSSRRAPVRPFGLNDRRPAKRAASGVQSAPNAPTPDAPPRPANAAAPRRAQPRSQAAPGQRSAASAGKRETPPRGGGRPAPKASGADGVVGTARSGRDERRGPTAKQSGAAERAPARRERTPAVRTDDRAGAGERPSNRKFVPKDTAGGARPARARGADASDRSGHGGPSNRGPRDTNATTGPRPARPAGKWNNRDDRDHRDRSTGRSDRTGQRARAAAAPGARAAGASARSATPRAPVSARPGHASAHAEEQALQREPGAAALADGPRLSKRMAELGLCSRREADEWIEKGWVSVDGAIAVLGQRVRPEQDIVVDRRARSAQAGLATFLLNKPIGYVSGQPEDAHPPAAALLKPDAQWLAEGATSGRFDRAMLQGLAPAGRLDIDSTGLLVLTQDGRIARQLIGEQSEIEKEYLVRVSYGTIDHDVAAHFPAERLARLRHGLSLDGVALKPAHVEWQNGEQLRFVLTEGRKRQIRRMCELVGLEVVGLRRVRIGGVALGNLPVGQWRLLRADERF